MTYVLSQYLSIHLKWRFLIQLNYECLVLMIEKNRKGSFVREETLNHTDLLLFTVTKVLTVSLHITPDWLELERGRIIHIP